MEVNAKGFDSILLEEDAKYLGLLYAFIRHGDPDASVKIIKMDSEMHVCVQLSIQDFKQHVIQNLLFGHRLLGMKIVFSKSLAIQKSICYTIEF